MRGRIVLLAVLLLVGELAAQGLAGGLESAGTGPGGRPSALRDVAANWKALSILLVLVSVGLVALAFAISQAFSLPDLRAWAEVEMGEIFTTAFIIISIVGIFVFLDVVAAGLAQNEPLFAGLCEASPGQPCSLVIANSYVDSYIGSAAKLYETISIRRIEIAQSAYKTYGLMGTYSIYLYWGTNFRGWNVGRDMIDMETYDQLLQFLGTIISTLHTQKFLLNLLMSVGPLVLLLGIILRSFFLTRKLGGLMMAFGIGFMLVYPATYALAYFTLNAAVYGVDTSAASGASTVCPQICQQMPPKFVESAGEGEGTPLAPSELRERLHKANLPEGGGLCFDPPCSTYYFSEEDVAGTVERFINGSDEEHYSVLYTGDDGVQYTVKSCDRSMIVQQYTDDKGLWWEKCDYKCREIPFPHNVLGCTNQEKICEVAYESRPECFIVREVDRSDPVLAEVDIPSEVDGCPVDCRAKMPGGITTARRHWAFYEDPLADCPPQCRWISTTGYTDPDCPEVCRRYKPTDPAIAWEGEELDKSLYFYIIPEIVFTNPEHCEQCIYVLDKGMTYKPQVFANCQTMCGTAGGASYSFEDPATMTNQVEGFVGTTEMKSVSKLAIPAFVLPIFGLVVTLMFIQALSPMLGGDIDIPGMMRML